MKLLDVEIVTAEKTIFSGQASLILVPGIEGELGILSSHAPIITELDPGEVLIRNKQSIRVSYSQSPGFESRPILANYFANSTNDNSGQKVISITATSSISRNGKVARYTVTMD